MTAPDENLSAEYVLDEADMVAFFAHHGRQSKVQRQSRLVLGYVIPAILIAYIALRLTFSRDWKIAYFDTIPLMIITFMLVFGVTLQTSKKRLAHTRKLMREGMNRNLVSPRRIEIGPEGFNETWQFGKQSLDWRAIERVAWTDTHLFLYVSAISAHIVPRRAFECEAEFKRFCEWAQRYQQAQVRGRCGECGYDLLGTKGERCPECGRQIATK